MALEALSKIKKISMTLKRFIQACTGYIVQKIGLIAADNNLLGEGK